jgi:ketosteroid isomerase-like protein
LNFEALAEKWNQAWLDKDVAFVDDAMSPDYFYIAANGQLLDRKAILEIIASPTYKLERGAISEQRVIEIAPTVAALLHRWKGAGSYQGRPFVDDHRCITVFVKRGERWLFAFEQVTPL